MIMDDHGWFSLLGVRRGSTGFFLEGGVLEDQWQDPMAKFYTETNLGPLSQASWSFFSVIFVLFCSVLFCSVLWRSMMTLHMTFFFSPSPCHRTGPIGQTQKAIKSNKKLQGHIKSWIMGYSQIKSWIMARMWKCHASQSTQNSIKKHYNANWEPNPNNSTEIQ